MSSASTRSARSSRVARRLCFLAKDAVFLEEESESRTWEERWRDRGLRRVGGGVSRLGHVGHRASGSRVPLTTPLVGLALGEIPISERQRIRGGVEALRRGGDECVWLERLDWSDVERFIPAFSNSAAEEEPSAMASPRADEALQLDK